MGIKRVLHLTLKEVWFFQIAHDVKKVEYRQIKPYWTKRLMIAHIPSYTKVIRYRVREFDEVHFTNGYGKHRPFMRVEWKGMSKKLFGDREAYAIKLGKVLGFKNYEYIV